jgi:hypothetical protein
MSIEMHAYTILECFSLLPIPHNRILRNTQLATTKLHFFFSGKIASFATAGVLNQRSQKRYDTNLPWPGSR